MYRLVLVNVAQKKFYAYTDFRKLEGTLFLVRVRHKVLHLVAKSQQGLAQKYLCALMYKPLSARSSHPLRSADRCDLFIPWSRTPLSQNWAFAVVVPSLWNDTLPALRSVMLHGISSASLRSLKIYFHKPVTLRAPVTLIAFCERRFTNSHLT